jgi:hypothetical protein
MNNAYESLDPKLAYGSSQSCHWTLSPEARVCLGNLGRLKQNRAVQEKFACPLQFITPYGVVNV